MVNFKNEVEKIKDELVADMITLCEIPSVQDDDSVKEGQPFGKPCRDALDAMLAIGKRDGFVTDDVDGYAGHIDIGDCEDAFAVLGHLDVVPVNPVGWDTDPFKVVIKDGKAYARGVADDKGPLLAGYYAAKIVNAMDFPKKMKTRVIFGCNEEMGSACLTYYFKKRPYPVAGFTPDGAFPVVYGEKAGGRGHIEGEIENDGVLSLKAGSRANIVPEECVAFITGEPCDYETSYNAFLSENGLKGSLESVDGNTKITCVGKSAHASMPEVGINSVVYLSKYLCTVTSNKLVAFIAKYFPSYYGADMGIDFVGEMGPLTVNLGVISYESKKLSMDVDMRCPHDIDFDGIKTRYEEICAEIGVTPKVGFGTALYVDPQSELIQTLHNSYLEISGDNCEPQAIGGGTYAKKMPNCVAFGPQFPGENNSIHENNESISIESLMRATEIYAKVLYDMIKA